MRLKGRSIAEARKLRRIHEEFGYFPHFVQCGRIRVEARFLPHPLERKYFVVQLVTTGEVRFFNRNGTCLCQRHGKLTGVLVQKRRIKICLSTTP